MKCKIINQKRDRKWIKLTDVYYSYLSIPELKELLNSVSFFYSVQKGWWYYVILFLFWFFTMTIHTRCISYKDSLQWSQFPSVMIMLSLHTHSMPINSWSKNSGWYLDYFLSSHSLLPILCNSKVSYKVLSNEPVPSPTIVTPPSVILNVRDYGPQTSLKTAAGKI